MMQRLLCTVVLLLLGASRPSDAQDLHLRTSSGHEVALPPRTAGGHVVVYSDREGAKLAAPWLHVLHEQSIAVTEVANLAAAPAVARPFVRRAFNKSPHVLLDWKGALAGALRFAPNLPNLYVYNPHGNLCGHVAGAADRVRVESLLALLAECRRDA